MPKINITSGDQPGTQTIYDNTTGDKHVISDGGSRVDTYNGTTHSWGTYNQAGEMTGGGVGETHEH